MEDENRRTVTIAAKMHEENKDLEREGLHISESEWELENKKQAYNEYVKRISPTKNLFTQMLKAFITGGIICTIGQVVLNICKNAGLDKDTSGSWASLILVLLSVLLTSFSAYKYIADWGGAGALVPITGFANSVCAPALEYKPEGQVFGIGVKIFTIAGPVILYGIFTSWICGFIYWLFQVLA